MKKTTINKGALLIASLIFSSVTFAYTDDKPAEFCKKPKFTDTNFPVYSQTNQKEVTQGALIKFRMSVDTDIKTLKIKLKDRVIEPKISSTSTFHEVEFKLPEDLTGYVRINVLAKAILKCSENTGWLIKIAGGSQAAATAESAPVAKPASATQEASHDAHHEAAVPAAPASAAVGTAVSDAATAPTAQRTTLLEQKTELPANIVNAKVIKVLFPVGFKTPTHTHDGPGPRYVIKGSLKIEDKSGSKNFETGQVFWETGEEMTIENIGQDVAEVVIFEMAPVK